jgi:hypothetical protein
VRFHHTARRMLLAPPLGLALAAAITACSSGSSSSSSSAPASSATASASASSSASSSGPASAVAAITANWEAFFSGKTPASKKIQLLQNGQRFSSVVNSQASSGLASSAAAKVTSVDVTSSSQATVVYDVLLGGSPALSGQKGTAVYTGGTWKVGDSSFCGLLALENSGKAPSVCSSAS